MAQQPTVEVIQGQPTSEVYDLLKDKKGYLWLGHHKGIARFDGAQFIHFSNPYQNSNSITSLLEDEMGRIWCHNFTGQIFYIKDLQMHLLEAYKYEEESGFPRLQIVEDELIATSVKGLFVYNLVTGASRYHKTNVGTTSLTLVGNKIIAFGNGSWFVYQKQTGVLPLKTNLELKSNQLHSLQPVAYKDTFFLISNPSGTYYKLLQKNDSVVVQSENNTIAFINTISVDGDRAWVHTKHKSITLDKKDSIKGLNLSDVLTDAQGNKWISSLDVGLSVAYNSSRLQKLKVPYLENDEFYEKAKAVSKTLYIGTSKGKLFSKQANGTLLFETAVPAKAGGIEGIFAIDTNHVFIAAAVGLFIYHPKEKSLKTLPINLVVKDIAINKGVVYLATTTGIRTFPLALLYHQQIPELKTVLFDKRVRCRSIVFWNDQLVAAYSDGVFIKKGNRLEKLLVQNKPVYASKVVVNGGKLVMATFTQGLMILDKNGIDVLTKKEGLIANWPDFMKSTASEVWMAFDDHVQKLDAQFKVGNSVYTYPGIKYINDFEVIDEQLYLVTDEGAYQLNTAAHQHIPFSAAIDKILINGQETSKINRFKYFQNNIQFQVSAPFFSPYVQLNYQYRIVSGNDSTWQTGLLGQASFQFIALDPGHYTFEVIAADKSGKAISAPAQFYFEILPPWYKTWYFKLALIILFAGAAFWAVRSYYKNRLKRQRANFEKTLALQAERQRIAAEIHDDIGAGLSAIRLLAEMSKNKSKDGTAQQEFGKIHQYVSELSVKIKEVIWSLNRENDSLEKLMYYIQRQALQLFENSKTDVKIIFPEQPIPQIEIDGNKRRHIFLTVKEALHNCLKHAHAEVCILKMDFNNKCLLITIADNGKGFDYATALSKGSGLSNMQKRIEQLKGKMEVESEAKTEIQLQIPLNENYV